MVKIAVVGTGYVGLVSGALLAEFGNKVICADINKEKIEALNNYIIPIYEPGLEEVVKENVEERRLSFTTDLKHAIEESDMIFIAVGTPQAQDGSANLEYVFNVAKSIGENINDYKVIVDKSTVPVGTAQEVKNVIKSEIKKRGVDIEFDVVSNPEFLREGSAVYDFRNPDRIIIGYENARALKSIDKAYDIKIKDDVNMVYTNVETAEMIKYATNAYLALKITYINEVANLCEATGANITDVAKSIGLDSRISPKFLNAGPGYGGSCFPKDTSAFAKIARDNGELLSLIEQTITANDRQKNRMVEKISENINLKGKSVCILGITYKPNTDDMREAPSLVIVPEIAKRCKEIRIFDPQGEKEGKHCFKEIENLGFYDDKYEAVRDADVAVVITEWNEIKEIDLLRAKELMRGDYLFDLRNIFDMSLAKQIGFKYFGVGR